jgi:predicted PurR-regulated permease PerM
MMTAETTCPRAFRATMKPAPSPDAPAFQDRAFLLLLALISAAFAWILWPLFGAILWGIVAAILFAPLYRGLAGLFGQRRTLAALATVTIIMVLVILPLMAVGGLLVKEAAGVYQRMQSGELNFGQYLRQVFGTLPGWVTDLFERLELADSASLQERLSSGAMKFSQFLAARAITVGHTTVDFIISLFVMLYLLFFLLRDGEALAISIRRAIPLREEVQRDLGRKFATVIRATVKGNIVVAIVQGALGGLIFWFLGIQAPVLWAVLMAFLSLLPAVGTALVWLPVAIWFLATGAVWQGILLIAYGVLVIGLVDNFLRPMLVGKDTKLPDYLVLISTLGGMAIFGANGFVIGPIIAALFVTAWSTLAAYRSDHA